MSVAARNACPTAWAPLPSGDGLLARLRAPLATLAAADGAAIDALANRYGNGLAEITARGNLQLRGLRPDGVAPVARALAARGLAGVDVVADRRRRLECSPLAGLDGIARALHGPLAAAVAAAVARAERHQPGLRPKFTVRLVAGPLVGAPIASDLAVLVSDAGVAVALRGSELPVSSDDAPGITARLIEAVAAQGTRRVAGLDDATAATLLGSCGGCAPVRPAAPVAAGPEPVGVLTAVPGGVVGLAPLFGALAPGQLGALADLAARYGDGVLRLAPRAVLIAGVAERRALIEAAAAAGLLADPADRRLRVRACAGAPACGAGHQAARTVAPLFVGLAPAQGVLHVSGCRKGCAHPGPAALALVGRPDGWAVLAGARADAAP